MVATPKATLTAPELPSPRDRGGFSYANKGANTMDQYATFGPQAAFVPKKVDHIVRVYHHPHAAIMGECSCGRRFRYMSPPALRAQVNRHAAALVDEAPGQW
jgi:hypothetical protein